MPPKAPRLVKTVVVGDDPYLLAELSTLLARKGSYLPVLDGPRLTRLDANAEVIRRTNAIARVQPTQVVLAGLPTPTSDLLKARLPKGRAIQISSVSQLASAQGLQRPISTLQWGKQNIGLGVLHALRGRHQIAFTDCQCPADGIGLDADHIVVCEGGDEYAQVLAANYAYSLGAGLSVLRSFPQEEAEGLLECLYSLYDRRDVSPTTLLDEIKNRMRRHAGSLPLREGMSVTFFTARLPWGLAFPEVPSTHLFNYPDLGIALINGIVAEHPQTPGIRAAVVIDPGSVDSKEIETARVRLTDTGVLTKALRSQNATVYQVGNTIRLFPYDLLIVSTHCGDVEGERRTYEFVDSEGRQRTLVVDVGVALEIRRPGEDVKVTEFVRFVSIDGVDWNDHEGKQSLPVGTAINDFFDKDKRKSLVPISRENVRRVTASMALGLADGNYIHLPEPIASRQTPIVFNNACASWHRLAGDFMFGGARAYIGTLFSVTDSEAQLVVDRMFGKYYGKDLAVALWRAQRAVYSDGVRRPYVLVGCHFQQLRTTPSDAITFVLNELMMARDDWRRQLQVAKIDADPRKSIEAMIEFLHSEVQRFVRFQKQRLVERRGG